jgi:hypothetical protein
MSCDKCLQDKKGCKPGAGRLSRAATSEERWHHDLNVGRQAGATTNDGAVPVRQVPTTRPRTVLPERSRGSRANPAKHPLQDQQLLGGWRG